MATDTPTVQLYRILEAGARLALSRSSIYREISSGNLKAVRIGKSLRISAAELERFAGSLEEGKTSKEAG